MLRKYFQVIVQKNVLLAFLAISCVFIAYFAGCLDMKYP